MSDSTTRKLRRRANGIRCCLVLRRINAGVNVGICGMASVSTGTAESFPCPALISSQIDTLRCRFRSRKRTMVCLERSLGDLSPVGSCSRYIAHQGTYFSGIGLCSNAGDTIPQRIAVPHREVEFRR